MHRELQYIDFFGRVLLGTEYIVDGSLDLPPEQLVHHLRVRAPTNAKRALILYPDVPALMDIAL